MPLFAGLSPGDRFHLVFVTSTKIDAVSADIADYDAHVNAAAAGSTIPVVGITGKNLLGDIAWKAIVSTVTVDARDNIGDPTSPIYKLDDTKIADDETDLFDGALAAPIDLDESLSTLPGTKIRVLTGSASGGSQAFSGPFGLGAGNAILGPGIPPIGIVWAGFADFSDSQWISAGVVGGDGYAASVYAISEELTVHDPEPLELKVGAIDALDEVLRETPPGALYAPGGVWNSGYVGQG